jgi:RNA polymerase sigma-70 factor (ECF subfamily)
VSDGFGSGSERGSDTQREFMRLADTALAGAYRLAAHLLTDRIDAEDAIQEALTLAWRGWPRLRDASRFGPWFDRIVVNVCYERLRGRRRAGTMATPEPGLMVAKDPAAATLARDTVGRALLSLTPEQRIVVVLRFWLDLSIEEIAERVGVPSGTVRSRLHYAMQRLKAEIDQPDGSRSGADA